MTRSQRDQKYSEITKFMTTPMGIDHRGKTQYPTLEDGQNKFGYTGIHIHRICKLLGVSLKNRGEES